MRSKVYICGPAVLVGSADASAHGLGEAGATFRGRYEAGVYSEEPSLVRAASAWQRWLARPVPPPVPLGAERGTLIEALEADLEWLEGKRVRVVCYIGEDASKEAFAAYRRVSRERSLPAGASNERTEEEPPFYEVTGTGWDMEPGDIILDFNCSRKRARPRFSGFWRVRDDPYVPAPTKDSPGNRIILLEQLPDLFRLDFDAGQQARVRAALARLIDENGWTEDDHGNLVDQPLEDLWPRLRARL